MEEEEDDEEEDRSQDREAHFVRACAGDMRMDISPEPFCIGIYRQNGRGRLREHRFVRVCAVEMHMDRVQEQFCMEIYQKQPGTPPGTSFCASLRSRNGHRHFTRAILC